MGTEKQIVVDKVILVCDGCLSERIVSFDIPLRGAEELITIMKEKVTRWCSCGAKTCEVRAHLQEEN